MSLPFTIYITHGGNLVITTTAKILAARCKELQILLKFEEAQKKYNLLHISKEFGSSGIEIPKEPLTTEELISLINQLKNCNLVDPMKVNLTADANLGVVGGPNVTEEFHNLVCSIAPTSIIPFTETDECIIDAQKYLMKESTNLGFIIPDFVQSGKALMKMEMAKNISQEMERPSPISSTSGDYEFSRASTLSSKDMLVPEVLIRNAQENHDLGAETNQAENSQRRPHGFFKRKHSKESLTSDKDPVAEADQKP